MKKLKQSDKPFSPVSDGDVEESCFIFNTELRISYQQFSIFIRFINTFFKKSNIH